MSARAFSALALALVLSLLVAACAAAPDTARPIPAPLPGHPGNIFLAGEDVLVPLPAGAEAAWQATDYDGQLVREGQAADGQAALGQLPVGYFELRRKGEAPRVSLAVLAPLAAPTPATSPIGLDVAMAWFYDKNDGVQMPAAANLCALAGVNWVRDRLAWGEVEPTKGAFAPPTTRYDHSAAVQSAAGLRVLQVNHSSPSWANPDGQRFPLDLRDAYRFYRAVAQRWQGQVAAFEPWNEADIDVFGGHTGAEMAALQKAAYLGLKAGNPNVIACQNVYAMSRQPSLDDLTANQAWAYFDTCNLHHYGPADQYPAWYAPFRQASAGWPLWTTEFAMAVQWTGDAKAAELNDATAREQARRVPIVFASALHEGPQAAFYFMLPHYVEGKTQFGIVHRDLTPRPAYVALAAVGRLLADAKPRGRLKAEKPAVRGFVFRAQPDGREQDVLVAWTTAGEADVNPPAPPLALFDLLGRPVAPTGPRLHLTSVPVYALWPAGGAKALPLEAPPAAPPRREAKPSPIVLQALWPKERIALARSAYRIDSTKPQKLPVFVYNFGDAPARGTLRASGLQAWKLALDRTDLTIAPGERLELALDIDCQQHAYAAVETLTVTGDFGAAGSPVLSVRVQPEPVQIPAGAMQAIPQSDDATQWHPEVTAGAKLELAPAAGPGGAPAPGAGVAVNATFGPGDRWAYPRLDLTREQRPPAGTKELVFKLTAVSGQAHYRVIFVEESGAAYVGELVVQPQPGQTIDAAVLLDDAIFGQGWSPPDPDGKLDVDQIKAIKIGCNTKDAEVRYRFSDLRWVKP